jgi:hypothetical protein
VYPLSQKEEIPTAYKITKKVSKKGKNYKIKNEQIKLIHALYHEHGNLRIVSEFFNKVSDVKLSSTSIYKNKPANFTKKVKNSKIKNKQNKK